MSNTSDTQQSSIASSFKMSSNDTGSTEVQVALLTGRIAALTGHFKTHAKDFSGRRGLLTLVSKRRSLLAYLKKKSVTRYKEVISKLNLRH